MLPRRRQGEVQVPGASHGHPPDLRHLVLVQWDPLLYVRKLQASLLPDNLDIPVRDNDAVYLLLSQHGLGGALQKAAVPVL